MADKPELADLIQEREKLKGDRTQLQEAQRKIADNLARLTQMQVDSNQELHVIGLQLVKLNQQIVAQCTAEIASEGLEMPKVAGAPVLSHAGGSALDSTGEYLPSMADFKKLVDAKPNKDIQLDVQDRMSDKSMNQLIDIAAWPDREGKMRGAGWRQATAAGELTRDDRACVAQMSKDGKKVSVVEGRVTSIEEDGAVTMDVGGNIVEVDTKGAACKIYKLTK
jgi:hypothetical protein